MFEFSLATSLLLFLHFTEQLPSSSLPGGIIKKTAIQKLEVRTFVVNFPTLLSLHEDTGDR